MRRRRKRGRRHRGESKVFEAMRERRGICRKGGWRIQRRRGRQGVRKRGRGKGEEEECRGRRESVTRKLENISKESMDIKPRFDLLGAHRSKPRSFLVHRRERKVLILQQPPSSIKHFRSIWVKISQVQRFPISTWRRRRKR